MIFFVFTFKGNVKVDFDTKYWVEFLDNLNWFWRKFIAPGLLTNKLKSNMRRIVDDKHPVAGHILLAMMMIMMMMIAHNKVQKKELYFIV